MENIVCESCGKEIHPKAKICPYCHHKRGKFIGAAKSVFFSMKKLVSSLLGLGAIVLICYPILTNYLTSEGIVGNEGKGADDPTLIAKTYIMALDERNADLVSNYLDDAMNNSKLIEGIKQKIQEFEDQGVEKLNIEGMRYDVSKEYQENGRTCVDVTVYVAEEGLFGGDAIFGKNKACTVYLHKSNTPDGEKWFLGK